MNRFISILTALLLLSGHCFAQTNVKGQIRQNTTWTKAGSPYTFQSRIEVDPNATLTIEPGVVVNMRNHNFDIYGKIVINTNLNDSVIISGDQERYYEHGIRFRGNIDSFQIKYCRLANIMISSMSSAGTLHYLSINNCRINNVKISIRGNNNSQILYSNNQMNNGTTTFANGSSTKKIEILNNSFSNCLFPAFYGSAYNGEYKISNNNFSYNKRECIDIVSADTVEISNNIFHNNLRETIHIKSPLYIHNNVFSDNIVAIQGRGADLLLPVTIEHNSIFKNDIGLNIINSSSAPNLYVKNNCFYDNKTYAIAWEIAASINLGTNWWGTTDTAKIDNAIYDYIDDFKVGSVSYKPFLHQKDPNCKTYTPPTAIPNKEILKNTANVYPNPFNNAIHFEVKESQRIREIQLYNLVGKLLHKSTVNTNKVSIDSKGYPSGVYFYKLLTTDNETLTGKVIKR